MVCIDFIRSFIAQGTDRYLLHGLHPDQKISWKKTIVKFTRRYLTKKKLAAALEHCSYNLTQNYSYKFTFLRSPQ
jgi:hypothetical protein